MARWKKVREMRIKAGRLGPIGFVRAHPSPVFVSGAIQKGVLRHKSMDDSPAGTGSTMYHLDIDALVEGEELDAALDGFIMGTDRFIEIEQKDAMVGDWITVGRTAQSDVVINDYTVSKHHARMVRKEQGYWTLEELGSTNGTIMNHVSIPKGQEIQLVNGMCVIFGRVELTFLDSKGFFEFLTG